jgi:anti-sigma-K factor RskA
MQLNPAQRVRWQRLSFGFGSARKAEATAKSASATSDDKIPGTDQATPNAVTAKSLWTSAGFVRSVRAFGVRVPEIAGRTCFTALRYARPRNLPATSPVR